MGLDYSFPTTDTVIKAPTCAEEGESLRVCNDCGYETSVSTPAAGHTEGEWETVKAPAVGVTGEMAVKCAVCGETVRTQTIPALSDGGQGGEGGDQGEPSAPPATGGCFSAATAAVSVFFTSVLPALAAVLGKRFLF